jgi:mannose/fructose-specific phosphotransferase system component IIA
MKQGVVIAHGPLGAAYIEAAKTIMGTDDGLFALSVTDMSVHEIASRLESIVNDTREDVDGIVIMACLRGGSSWNVSAAVVRDKPKVQLISGVNLAMLLTFLTKRDSLPLDELTAKLKSEAVDGVTILEK